MFEHANNLILNGIRPKKRYRRNILIDYNKCIELKKSIEEEIRNQENDLDFL